MTRQDSTGGAHDDRTPFADASPLFIVGAVRSGTTLTRDLLRRVPNFICPEETHFFRWSEPYRTPHSFQPHRNNQLLKKHRQMDGVTAEDFEQILHQSRNKAELQRHYITAFARAKGITAPYRWFDKTPQNVYGAPLIAQEMPEARFLNLVRNPLNVVASLILGRQVKIPDLHGACNYWIEAVQIMTTVADAYGDRVLTLRYEDLVADVPGAMAQILDHAGVAAPRGLYHASDAHKEQNLWRTGLTPEQAGVVRNRCGVLARRFGYDIADDLAQPDAAE